MLCYIQGVKKKVVRGGSREGAGAPEKYEGGGKATTVYLSNESRETLAWMAQKLSCSKAQILNEAIAEKLEKVKGSL